VGIGDFISDITPDSVEDAVEDGVEWVGNRVEDAGNWTADRLDDVGWESGADWVREQSRSVANRLGAESPTGWAPKSMRWTSGRPRTRPS
jgi:hypothetical protein